jgi:hypothetical protein
MWEWMKKALYKGLLMNGGSIQGDCGKLASAQVGAHLGEQEVDGNGGHKFNVAMATDNCGGADKRHGETYFGGPLNYRLGRQFWEGAQFRGGSRGPLEK